MDIHVLANLYQSKTDGELLQLAAESDQLTLEARTALKGELAKRRLNATEHRHTFLEPVQYCEAEDQEDPGTPFRLGSQSTADFIAEVLRWYRGHLWLFVKLIAPAVFVGIAAVITGRHEGREIARNFLATKSSSTGLNISRLWRRMRAAGLLAGSHFVSHSPQSIWPCGKLAWEESRRLGDRLPGFASGLELSFAFRSCSCSYCLFLKCWAG